jgi:deoxyribodipyrimidine photo-lyase
MTIQSTRIAVLADAPVQPDADYVLYWMQASQRAGCNPALEIAIEHANALDLPVLVCFGLTDGYPEANARHYAFMLEGLADAAAALRERGIGFVIAKGDPDAVALRFSRKAALVVCDRGYLSVQRLWRDRLARDIDRRLIQVEGDVVVPIQAVTGKHEFAARTIRPKIHRLWDEYLQPLAPRSVGRRLIEEPASEIDLRDPRRAVESLSVDMSVSPVKRFTGGEAEARRRLDAYLGGPFRSYGSERGRPEAGAASHMSPYLHFGQISPLEIALSVRDAKSGGSEDKATYLEELIVRRELAMNHVYFQPNYDRYECLPEWALKTLDKARSDPRDHIYDADTLAAGRTHDEAWNVAMLEMRATGYMHNHLRMYWGKKIIEWSASPEEAFATTLLLNNRYFIDGRDANSYTNVGWLFGLHDRPWFNRPIFGSVRYMGAATLKKFDYPAYAATVRRLAAIEGQ